MDLNQKVHAIMEVCREHAPEIVQVWNTIPEEIPKWGISLETMIVLKDISLFKLYEQMY